MPRKRTRLSEAEAQELQQAYLNTKNGPWRTRYQAVRLYGLGYAVSEIVALTGCSQSRLGAWYRAYRAGGVASWRDGRQGGNRARLTASEVRDLQGRLEPYTPRQVLGDTAATADGQFWTVDDLRAVVTRWYAVQSQRPTFDRHLFERGGCSSQKPSAVYTSGKETDLADFSAALKKKVLDLAQASEPSVILARDEASLDLQATVQRVWAPNGQTPVVRVAPTRLSVHCYGTLNLLTGQEVSMRTGTMNAAASARHLPQLLEADPTGQILLLWDQAPWHQGAAIRDILAANPRLELMRLPPAAPALNPQEHVCKAVRSAVSHNHTLARFPDLVERWESALAATTFPCALLDTLNFHHLRILFTMSN